MILRGMPVVCNKYLYIALIVLSFGAGIVVTYFLPAKLLVILEAAIIIAAGLFCILGK